METHQNFTNSGSIWESNKLLIKGLLIGFFVLIMLIPFAYIMSLINERKARQQEVTEEISSKWATSQNIVGPVIKVPYSLQPFKPGVETLVRYAYFLPEQLSVNGNVLPEHRHRSLYDVTLYRSSLSLSGSFDPSVVSRLGIPAENILWNDCVLLLGMNDTRGLEEDVQLQWNGITRPFTAGLPGNGVVKEGVSINVPFDPQKKMTFNIGIKLKGSGSLFFTPVGKTTDVAISSPWKSPAFDGQYLPVRQATINDKGFNAQWKVLQVSRNYPQAWRDSDRYEIEKSAFGVKFLQTVDSYAKTERSAKYAILIIALTFAVFFFIEILQKRQIHPLQYVLVGIALCIFYTLLLSISEYTGFNWAYLIAACATIALIGSYVRSIFQKLSIAAGFTTALTALYAYIFILIQLEDYALLFGSIGLFVILAVIMYYSRKVDWYGTNRPAPSNI